MAPPHIASNKTIIKNLILIIVAFYRNIKKVIVDF